MKASRQKLNLRGNCDFCDRVTMTVTLVSKYGVQKCNICVVCARGVMGFVRAFRRGQDEPIVSRETPAEAPSAAPGSP